MYFDDILFKETNESISNSLFSPDNGLLYGNMFPNELDLYGNYKIYDFDVKTSKGNLLLDIYRYDFAINDLSLYLDLHPEDYEKYLLFKDYCSKLRNLMNEYEDSYCPLELMDSPYSSYEWSINKWPFAGGDTLV